MCIFYELGLGGHIFLDDSCLIFALPWTACACFIALKFHKAAFCFPLFLFALGLHKVYKISTPKYYETVFFIGFASNKEKFTRVGY